MTFPRVVTSWGSSTQARWAPAWVAWHCLCGESCQCRGNPREIRGSPAMCVPQQAYLSFVPGLELTEVPEAAELVVGPALGAVVYVPGTCGGTAMERDRGQLTSMDGEEPGSIPASLRKQLPSPSRGTHRPATGALRSPAAGGRVWPLPPSSLLLEASPVRAQEGHTRSPRGQGMPPVPRGCKPALLWD